MTTVYVDTNVIIARYKPGDPLHGVADELFKRDFEFVISPVTLVELYSVLSRVKPFVRLREEFKHASIGTLVAFIIHDLHLKLRARAFLFKLSLLGTTFRVPLEYHIAMKFSEKLQLKTLDLLHLAYAYMLREEIDYFVTGDDDILSRRELIRECMGIEVIEPSELLKTYH